MRLVSAYVLQHQVQIRYRSGTDQVQTNATRLVCSIGGTVN
ncbi:hypothetical protein [Paenibacillus illinoisensis]|nr:hypothetical protein [Paenibacillus illinoisensis]